MSPLSLPASLEIRPMLLTDLDEVVTLEAKASPSSWSRQGYANEIQRNQNAQYVVLECQGNIIGFAGLIMMLDEAHISIVAVDPHRQGNGLGKLLVLYLLRIAIEKKATLSTLEVREHNAIAQNLYRRLGFEQVGIRKHYYRDSGEDALIMTLEPLKDEPILAEWERLIAQLGS